MFWDIPNSHKLLSCHYLGLEWPNGVPGIELCSAELAACEACALSTAYPLGIELKNLKWFKLNYYYFPFNRSCFPISAFFLFPLDCESTKPLKRKLENHSQRWVWLFFNFKNILMEKYWKLCVSLYKLYTSHYIYTLRKYLHI